MECVRPGFGYGADLGFLTMLCCQAASFYFEFLQGVREGQGQRSFSDEVDVTGPVQVIGRSEAQSAAHGDDRSCKSIIARCCGLDRGAIERDQIRYDSSIERQFYDPLVLNDLADSGISGFNQSSV